MGEPRYRPQSPKAWRRNRLELRFGVKARIDRTKKVWYGEMKIPFGKLGVASPVTGTRLRTGIYRCAGREPNRKLISWQITGARSFHVPERFGILTLRD